MKRLTLFILFVFCFSIINCTSPIAQSFRKIQASLEQSNESFVALNKKQLTEIRDYGVEALSRQADSIFFASENLNGLIDEYKTQIINLDLTGYDVNTGYKVIATPDFIKGALISATSTLVKKCAEVHIDPPKKKRLDSLIFNFTQINSDTTYFTKHFKGILSANVLVALARLQLESSEITHLCLQSISQPLKEALPVYKERKNVLLMKYFSDEITPILLECTDEPKVGRLPTRLKMILSINENGQVKDVIFPEENLSITCKQLVKRKLLTMEGWEAPQILGKPIKTKYTCNISCLNWNY